MSWLGSLICVCFFSVLLQRQSNRVEAAAAVSVVNNRRDLSSTEEYRNAQMSPLHLFIELVCLFSLLGGSGRLWPSPRSLRIRGLSVSDSFIAKQGVRSGEVTSGGEITSHCCCIFSSLELILKKIFENKNKSHVCALST